MPTLDGSLTKPSGTREQADNVLVLSSDPATDEYNRMVGNLLATYKNHCTATVLVNDICQSTADTGVRLEVPAIMKVFTYGPQLGTGIEGLFFYNTETDFGVETDFDKVDNIGSVPSPTFRNMAHFPGVFTIDLYPSEHSHDAYATFITIDVNNRFYKYLGGWGFYPEDMGKWQTVNQSTASAWLRKITGTGNPVALTIDSLRKSAIFTIDDETDESPVAEPGTFYFRDVCDLTGDCVAKYDVNRLLFYAKNDITKPIGVFFPRPDSKGIPITEQDSGKDGPTATWYEGKAVLDDKGGYVLEN